MKTFSVITPVFNGEKYIGKCIEAIANADYDISRIEHIIVDDGSTDNTKNICEEYARRYNHIKFFSKENGNWGSVINFVKEGKLVNNDYVTICDADDILLSDCFNTVNVKNNDADLFLSAFYRWNGKKRKIKILPYFFLFKRNMIKKTQWHYHTTLIVPQSCWIKKEIFYRINNLKEKIAYQDTILFTNCFLESKTITYTTKATCLYWCIRPGNSMSAKNGEEGLKKLISNFDFYEKKGWLNVFFFYTLGFKKIRKYLKLNNLKYDFKNAKINLSGFPFYIRPLMRLLYLMLIRKYIKK